MTRYADPLVCPDCRTGLTDSPNRCPSCDLPLQHPLASELLRTLQYADHLVVRLRASATSAPAFPQALPVSRRQPDDQPDERPRRGLRAASVPTILLGLGALCLLVAAVIFLAVAWSWLGVGGRTATLVALTAASGAAGTWLAGRGLRVAGESLTLVALGLLTLDVIGADNAGWLGNPSPAAVTCLTGGVIAVVALALAALGQRLVVPQVVTALGLGTSIAAATDLITHDLAVLACGVVAFGALARLGRQLGLQALLGASLAGAGLVWVALTSGALDDVPDAVTLHGLWIDGPGWALVAATLLLLLPIVVVRANNELVQACAAGAASMLTLTVALPARDESLTVITAAALAGTLAWTGAALLVPGRAAYVARVPAALSALPLAGVLLRLLNESVERVLLVDGSGADLRLADEAAAAHPALVLPATLALLALAVVLVPRTVRISWAPVVGATVALAAVATLALYPVPLWTVVAALCLAGLGLATDAVRRSTDLGITEAVAGFAVALGALSAARPSDWLMAGSAAMLVAAAAIVLTGRFRFAAELGGLVLPAATAVLIWSGADAASVDAAYRAVPILGIVGLLAIARPRVEIESSAALAALAATGPAVLAASSFPTSLALHLTIAGALVSAGALVHPSRRLLGWVGGALLALATWVRLADLGVEAPEAYTLPTAAALLLVGLRRLRKDPSSSTATALTPGLVLGTVPTLLWVIAGDAVSLRAALLGVACLVLVVAGSQLQWSAPLVVGATVGGVLVLRELAPYAVETPQWVMIGLAGTLLTVIGVTWERRLLELRQAAGFLDRLR